MIMKQRKCVICGKLYTPTSPSQILCGSMECKKARHKQYIKEHEEMYKELNKEYRQREENKIARAKYDKKYQKENKQRIKAYKRAYWLKKSFLNSYAKGKLIKNAYWFTLSKEEQERLIAELPTQLLTS